MCEIYAFAHRKILYLFSHVATKMQARGIFMRKNPARKVFVFTRAVRLRRPFGFRAAR